MKTKISSIARVAIGLCAFALTTSSASAGASVFEQARSTAPLSAAGIPAASAEKQQTSVYIVQFKEQPIVNFSGSSSMAATKPEENAKLNIQTTAVQNYRAFLANTQNQALENCGVDKKNKVYEYTYSFNGMAAAMTPAQAALMRTEPNVLRVVKDSIQQMDTDSTREFLKLNKGRFASWRRGFTGEDVIVGVLDSGINPEHPSFADVPTPIFGDRGYHLPYGPAPASWTGDTCDFGNTDFNPLDVAFTCNNKLLGARTYSAGFLRGADPAIRLAAGSSLSARDDNGHGSAAASNAIGNFGVQASINGEDVGEDVMSGVAPRARLAVYKVCWDGPLVDDPTTPANEDNDDGCANSDSMAAIDQAVADGVDVINFSIGGSSTSFGSLDAIAFLFAANAGVHVATSAGNSGPDLQTVGTPAAVPWITSVGAVNDDQNNALGLQIDAPASLAGSVTAIEGAGSVTLAGNPDISGALVVAEPADGCAALTNPDAIAGNIALIVRGGCSFDDKYANAEGAGATALVVYNDGTAGDRINPFVMGGVDPSRAIPGVMIGFNDGSPLATATGPAVTLSAENEVSLENRVVDFSSRGPNGGALDIIKPDVVAPGVNILSAETSTENADAAGGRDPETFQFISGTSFSSPHVAGVLALIKQARPDWSPAIARSAMMTTARQNLSTQFSDVAATPFEIGAGHVVPNDTYKPGLAYDVGFADYAAFSCGNNVQVVDDAVCDFLSIEGRSFDGSELNLPSIGVGELVGKQTVTRTVTNVDRRNPYRYYQKPTRYKAVVDAPAGVSVTVNPRRLRLRPGQSADYTVTFEVQDDAVFNDFSFGSITWVEKGKRRKHHRYGRYFFNHYDYDNDDAYYSYDDDDYSFGYGSSYSYGYGYGYGFFGYRPHKRVAKEVRSPIAIRPVVISAPNEVDVSGVTAQAAIPVGFGYDGAYNAQISGLSQSFGDVGTVTEAGGLTLACFDLPAFEHLRVATYNANTTTPGQDDLDLRVFRVDACGGFDGLAQVGASGGPTSDETIDFSNSEAGAYLLVVDYFAAATGDSIDYTLWLSGVSGDNGNAVVSGPTSATLGSSETVTVDYQNLNAGSRYLGFISHQGPDGELKRTLIDVDTQ